MRAQMDTGSPARLVREIAEDSGTLIRKEIELAKHELTSMITTKLTAAATFAGAGLLALIAVVFAAHAVAAALAGVMSEWLAYLVVTVGLVGLAGFAAMFGLATMRKRSGALLPETTKTIKEDIGWARKQLKR